MPVPVWTRQGKPFYAPYEAQEMVKRFSQELGVRVIPFRESVYLPEEDRYDEVLKITAGTRTASISGTHVREEYLNNGKTLPAPFTRPEVAEIFAVTYLPRHRQGVCVCRYI